MSLRHSQLLRRLVLWPVSPRVTSAIGNHFRSSGRRTETENAPVSLKEVRNILVVRLDRIGDMVMTTPFLRELKREAPDAQITLVVNPACHNLVETCPYADNVFQLDMNARGRPAHPCVRYVRTLRFAEKYLRHYHFDLAIVPRWATDEHHATYLAYWSRASHRIGFSEDVNADRKKWNRDYDRLLTRVIHDDSVKHEVLRNLDIIERLGGKPQNNRLELWPTDEDRQAARRFLDDNGVGPEDGLAAIAPAAGHPRRMWPLSGFEETGTWLTQKHNLRTVIVGGPSEKALCSALSRKIGESSINAAGRLTLRQSATLLECCSIFLGNDSGLMHVAATVGLPVIALYSHPENVPTSANNLPERFRPWTASYTMLRPPRAIPPCTVDCIANNSHCICDISTVMVKEAIAQQLTRTQIRKQGHKHT